MGILFITSSRIGDAILSMGILDQIIQDYPDVPITVACGPLVSDFFKAIPQVEAVFPLKKQSFSRHWLKLWPKIARKRWRMVVDLRDSAVSRLIFAEKRYIYGSYVDKSLHKIAQNAAVMRYDDVPAPRLWFDRNVMEAAARIMGQDERPIVAVGPAANWIGKTWPADRFIAVIEWLTRSGSPFENARIAVIAAPGEEVHAKPVLDSIASGRSIDLIAKTTPYQASACLSLCDFYIGNDSGLMHASAACGVPTFGLFGPSWPHLYAPYGRKTAFAKTDKTFDELIDYPGYTPQTAPCLMEGLSVETVKQQLDAFVQTI